MSRRLELHAILKQILGSNYVYFQPPNSIQLEYPCIIYKRDRNNTKFANDKPYSRTKRYQITIIDRDPDSEIPDKVAALPMCLFDRFYTADKLNHDVYNIFF